MISLGRKTDLCSYTLAAIQRKGDRGDLTSPPVVSSISYEPNKQPFRAITPGVIILSRIHKAAKTKHSFPVRAATVTLPQAELVK